MTRLKERLQPIGGTVDGATLTGYVLTADERLIVSIEREMFEPPCGCFIVLGLIVRGRGEGEPWMGFDGCPAHEGAMSRVSARYIESTETDEGRAEYDGRQALEVAVEMWNEEASR